MQVSDQGMETVYAINEKCTLMQVSDRVWNQCMPSTRSVLMQVSDQGMESVYAIEKCPHAGE